MTRCVTVRGVRGWRWLCVGGGLASMTAMALAAGSASAPPPEFTPGKPDPFFEDARGSLGPGQPGAARPAGPAGGGMVVPSGGGPAVSPSAPAGGGGGAGWSLAISADTLESEIKAQVAELQTAVKSATEFKGGGHRNARVSFSYLAVLFGVVNQYDTDVRWKQQSAGLRKMFAQAGFNCKTSSDSSLKEAKVRTDDLAALVRGETIEIPAADAEMPWGEVANRPPLMTRMEVSRTDRIKPWTASRGDFTKNKDALIREAEVLTMLCDVIKHESFEYSDDESYQGYLTELRNQSQALLTAVRNDNQTGAAEAAAQINKACDACHGDFRG